MKMLDKIKNYAKHYENEVRDISNQLRDEMMPELSRELFDENLVTRYLVTVHTDQDHKNKVWDQKGHAAVFLHHDREAPNVSHTDRRTDTS